MRRVLSRRLAATGVVAVAIGVAVAAVPPPPALRAEPEVLVVHVTGPGAASAPLALVNQSAGAVTVAAITRDPSCDPEVTHTLATPVMIASGSAATVTIHCAGTITTGMKRCVFHATPGSGPAFADFEGVCEGGQLASLVSSTGSLDFGQVTIGGGASLPLTLTNTAAGATITRLFLQTTDLDGNFELGAPCNPDARECDVAIPSVGTGETTALAVWCRPKTAGPHTAQLRIATNTNQYVAPPIELVCEGTSAATPVFAITGDPVDAGDVEVTTGAASPMPVRLRNAGTGVLRITSVEIVDGGNGAAADWTYVASGECTGALSSVCELAPEEQLELQLVFDPSAIGTRDATLVIDYVDTAVRSRSVPLDGTGLGATLSLLDAPGVLDFGTVPLNLTSDLTFQLANHGNRPITAMLSAVPAGPPFSLVPGASIQVNPGVPATVIASCRPTVIGEVTTTFVAMGADAFMSAPVEVTARCEGTTSTLYADPTSIVLGEVRKGAQKVMVPITVLSAGAPLQITSATLAMGNPNLGVLPNVPATTPMVVQLVVDPLDDASLANELVLSAASGATTRLPISGRIATAAYQEPLARSLGTFCVNQPTTGGALSFLSTGTARIGLDAPEMALGAMSPFDVEHQAPTTYPAMLLPGATAIAEVTPRRSPSAGVQQDDVVWTTDVAQLETARTTISARFVDDGGAIAPDTLTFGPATIHLEAANAQSVTLQNCDTQTIVFEDLQVPAPFRIDIGNFPDQLAPNESVTFAIGFHPTRVGLFDDMLEIRSQQLDEPLTVRLVGEGARPSLPPDAGVMQPGLDTQSFYGCGGCSTRGPGGGLAIVLAVGFALRRRNRR